MNNLLKRSISGLLFAVILIIPLFYQPMFPVVVIVSLYLMMKEFYSISLGGEYNIESRLAILSAAMLFAILFSVKQFGIPTKWALLSFLPLIAAMVSVLFRQDNSDRYYRLPYIFMGLLYIGLPTSLTPVLVFREGIFNGLLMLSFFVIIWSSDIGAYLLGSALGQKEGAKKLAPNISPKKSWWGVAGGAVLAVAAAVVLNLVSCFRVPMVHAIAIALIICAAGICGDLFESVWKRYFHVKDSGNTVPGHGGLLDRFDSSLLAMPAATVYMIIFNLL